MNERSIRPHRERCRTTWILQIRIRVLIYTIRDSIGKFSKDLSKLIGPLIVQKLGGIKSTKTRREIPGQAKVAKCAIRLMNGLYTLWYHLCRVIKAGMSNRLMNYFYHFQSISIVTLEVDRYIRGFLLPGCLNDGTDVYNNATSGLSQSLYNAVYRSSDNVHIKTLCEWQSI